MIINKEVQAWFPVGCAVTLSAFGETQFPRLVGETGTVIGYRHGRMPKVKFEGKKTIDGWHPDLLRRIT